MEHTFTKAFRDCRRQIQDQTDLEALHVLRVFDVPTSEKLT